MPLQSIPTAKHKVLHVEDHPVNAMLMSAVFEGIADCELVTADCGRRALELAQDLHPALLLLDLRLPDVHGIDLLQRLRRIDGCELAPAIAVTAEDGFAIAGSGFDELWRKPLDLQMIIRRVPALLAQAENRVCALPPLPLLTTPALVARLSYRA